jgi:hypothetical protein
MHNNYEFVYHNIISQTAQASQLNLNRFPFINTEYSYKLSNINTKPIKF